MKTIFRYFLTMLLLAVSAVHCYADDQNEPIDTAYFFNSWEQMLDFEPIAMLINPYIQAPSPFVVYMGSDDDEVNRVLSEKGFIAASIGESVWLANSDYIKQEFDGDVSSFVSFVPLFFNSKIAYITFPVELSLKEAFFAPEDEYAVGYFYIDFKNRKVKKVTHKYLSELLEDYHDLKMRYEGMKDYKKREIIEYFFLQYVDRVTEDFMRNDITDYVE